MKKRILRFLKHIGLTILTLLLIAVCFGLSQGAAIHYGDNPARMNLDKEGPYIFYKNDSILNVNYIRGNKNDGFYVEQEDYPVGTPVDVSYYFPLDQSQVEFTINHEIKTPKTTYSDNEDVLSVSDIESGYKTFRDFLIANNVIDQDLNWTYGKGHLVLVGDFVDRGFSTTQVLWFIYKMEQDAKKHGGNVHFILGNHELKNMQGKYGAASPKYLAVSAILDKQQYELYSPTSFLGRWMSSKNSMELINGSLYVHGGIHPDLSEYNLSLEEVNKISRENYYKAQYPKPGNTVEELLLSNRNGISWYRGYFKDDLSTEEVAKGLDMFGAKSVVVGHNPQSKVKMLYSGKVIAIDVRHANDYHKNWPNKESEGLLVSGDTYYRVLADGKKIELK